MGTFSKSVAPTLSAVLLVLVPNVSLALEAASDDLFNSFFANVLDGAPCYARTYDSGHFKAHPGQKVRAIEIDLAKTNADGTPNRADRFELGFALKLTSGTEWYGQTASCRTDEADFDCYIEGDGGTFQLIPRDGGGLRLEAGEGGLSLDSSNGSIELSGRNADDRTFDLIPSKEECKSATEDLQGGND